jgi:hypothetical protein
MLMPLMEPPRLGLPTYNSPRQWPQGRRIEHRARERTELRLLSTLWRRPGALLRLRPTMPTNGKNDSIATADLHVKSGPARSGI